MHYNDNENGNYNNQNGNNTNTLLIAILSFLGALVIAVIIFAVLFLTGVISPHNEDVPATEMYMAEEVQEPVVMYVANVENSIYFRSEPVEAESNIITTIPLGTPIIFIEDANSVFAKIKYNESEGYVKKEYLSTNPAPAPVASPSAYSGNTTVQYSVFVSNVKNSIYLRSQPEENENNIVCTIPLGTEVGYIESTNSVFAKINYNGKLGYAKKEYLETYWNVHASEWLEVCNVKTSIYLRSAPNESGDNIICEIPVGSMVEFIDVANADFYKIRWNGYVGYSKSMYLR